MNQKLHNLKYLKEYRKELRNNATVSEKKLWKFLQKSQLENRKFRRQHSIGNYIEDFYCPREKLIIEVDGAIHNNTVNQKYDFDRETFLIKLGYNIIRFKNEEIRDSIKMVLEKIKTEFK